MTESPNPDARRVADLRAHLEVVAAAMSGHERPLTPEGVVEVARVAVPHAHHVGVTLLQDGRKPASAASTDTVPDVLDGLQFSLGDGPCLDAATGPPVVVVDDLAVDPRWPRYGPRCVETTGIRSMLCLRLPLGGDDHAGLNFYAPEVAAFDDGDVAAGTLLVPFAALVIEAQLRHEQVRNLSTALQSNRMIGTAVGILMATRKLSEDDAFAVLRRTSMDLNAKLRDVAEHVGFTGDLPDRGDRVGHDGASAST